MKLPSVRSPKMRKPLIILLIILTILIIFSAIGINKIISDDDIEIVAVASVDRDLVRLGETFNFSANGSKGEIEEFIWDFGDGNVSSDKNPTHAYEFAGKYNVTLSAIGKGDNEDNTTLVVGNQLRDYSRTSTQYEEWDIRPRIRSGTGPIGIIGPNMGNPIVQIHGYVSDAIGEFELEVRVYYQGGRQTVSQQPYSALGETISIDVTIEPEDIREETEYESSELRVIFFIDQGRYGGMEITMDVEFPFTLE